MKQARLGIRGKSLLSLLSLSLFLFAVLTFLAIYYIFQISEFAQLSNISLGKTAADSSSEALAEQYEDMVQQKALDTAEGVRIYLAGHPNTSPDSLASDPDFSRIALQKIGETGYTCLFDTLSGIILHPEQALVGTSLQNLAKRFPGFQSILDGSLNGSPSGGYCDWVGRSGESALMFVYTVPVENTRYIVAAGMQKDELTRASTVIREEINNAALSTSEYIDQQKAGMFRVFLGVIIGLLIIVAALAFWLAKKITQPILALKEGSKIIAGGNFDHRFEIKSGDEIQQLAEQYNQMAAALKESYVNLEQKVAFRTAELSETNARLQKEIVQREEAQEALRKSEIKYRHLVEKANCIILEMDTSGRVTFFNKFGQDFFGYPEEEIIGRSVVGTIVPVRDASGQDMAEMINDLTRHPEKYSYNENENMRRNGERVWILWLNQPLYDKDDNYEGVLCLGLDRTPVKLAEEIREKQAKEAAAAAERNRLARDLHDAVSQTLFSASIIADVLPRLWEKNPEEGRKRLAEIRELTRGALAEMRALLLELRPAVLMEAELGLLLHQLGEAVTGRVRIPVNVTVEGECRLPVEVKVSLYRIAQEALNNVAKHSRAKQAVVNLTCLDSEVTLVIKDNGNGFDTASISPEHLGLGIMQERARAIGASFNIQSSRGEGTRVTVVWQVKRS